MASSDSKHKYRLDYGPDEMQAKIESGELNLHRFPKGFALSEVRQFSTERVLFVTWLYGKDFGEWKEALLGELYKLAKDNHCVSIEAACRFGLEKALAPLGFERSQVLLRKEVL